MGSLPRSYSFMIVPAGTVVDTDVFSRVFLNPKSTDSRVLVWRAALANRRTLITFQTHAEVLGGARQANWGKPRMAQLIDTLARTPTIHSDGEVVQAYATLSAQCRAAGHPLHTKIHTGDRWIAACVIVKQLDLLSGDAIFRDVPNLLVRN